MVPGIACACYGQSLSLGVKGGVRLTDDLSSSAASEPKRYVAGRVNAGPRLGKRVDRELESQPVLTARLVRDSLGETYTRIYA